MWKNSLNHSNIVPKHWIACVSMYTNKYNMQLVSNGLTHIHMLIIEKMWKNSLIHFNINVGFEIFTCILINYDKYKMQLMNIGFNMLKVDGSIHVPNW
jgi:hypothetical protein